jgi:hypothetical protein
LSSSRTCRSLTTSRCRCAPPANIGIPSAQRNCIPAISLRFAALPSPLLLAPC